MGVVTIHWDMPADFVVTSPMRGRIAGSNRYTYEVVQRRVDGGPLEANCTYHVKRNPEIVDMERRFVERNRRT